MEKHRPQEDSVPLLSIVNHDEFPRRKKRDQREEGESARRHGNGTHGTHGLMFRVPLFRPAAAAVSCSIWNDSKVQSLVGVGRQRTQPEESQPESEATASERASRTCVPHVSARARDGRRERGWTACVDGPEANPRCAERSRASTDSVRRATERREFSEALERVCDARARPRTCHTGDLCERSRARSTWMY